MGYSAQALGRLPILFLRGGLAHRTLVPVGSGCWSVRRPLVRLTAAFVFEVGRGLAVHVSVSAAANPALQVGSSVGSPSLGSGAPTSGAPPAVVPPGWVRRTVHFDEPVAIGDASERDLRACVRSLRRGRAALDAHGLRISQELARREKSRRSFKAAEVLKAEGGLAAPVAKRQSVLAEQSLHFPDAVEGLARGQLTEGHLHQLARACQAHPGSFANDVAALTQRASETSVDLFRRHVSAWIIQSDADDGSERFNDQHRRRHVTFATGADGMMTLRGVLDPEAGSILQGAVSNLAADLLRAEGEGRRPVTTAGQRAADALVYLAAAGPTDFRSGGGGGPAQSGPAGRRAAPPDSGRGDSDAAPPRPARVLLHVRCDVDVLAGDLERARRRGVLAGQTSAGVALGAATIRRLACDAAIIPTVMGGSSQVLDVGRMRRTATPAQRSALEHRDRHCVFPGCDRPTSWCQVHHLVPWKAGGVTDLDNLAMVCSIHHHMVHEGRWNLRHDATGWIAIPPDDPVPR